MRYINFNLAGRAATVDCRSIFLNFWITRISQNICKNLTNQNTGIRYTKLNAIPFSKEWFMILLKTDTYPFLWYTRASLSFRLMELSASCIASAKEQEILSPILKSRRRQLNKSHPRLLLTKPFMASILEPLPGDGYFSTASSQEVLVLIWLNLEEWKPESNIEPCSSF